MPGPRDEYGNRLELRRAAHLRHSQVDARLSYFRLITFAILAAVCILAWRGSLTWGWCLGPVIAFAWVAGQHDRVIRARNTAARAVQFYQRGIARLDDQWAGTGEQGDRFADPSHPYATDLDLFGPGSLFELLSIARTRAGEDTLAAWLKSPAAPGVIGERHAAVDDLLTRLDLREAVWLAGTEVRAGVHGEALVAWAESAPLLGLSWLRGSSVLLATMAVVTFALWVREDWLTPLLLVLMLEGLLFFAYRPRIHQVLHSAGGWSRDLDLLAHVVACLEKESFSAPRLVRLREQLDAAGTTPAKAIRVLHRFTEMHDWQHNLIFAPIAMPLLWDVQIAFAMEAWRKRYGAHVRHWLDAVGEFEALSSLSAYGYEHPADRFPELVDAPEAVFDGVAMGHPLIPQARMVRNDVSLQGPTRLLLISGSNMSGKSTLLRTVGVNAVL
ncbi:MAG: mismatch repair protein, partial [Vicinamibacterales bacterium]